MATIDAWAAGLPTAPAERAIALFAAQLTLDPNGMTVSRLDALRSEGLSEREVYDVVMVAACFAFMNRLADGTGVAIQADRFALARELLGEDALAAHLRWSDGAED